MLKKVFAVFKKIDPFLLVLCGIGLMFWWGDHYYVSFENGLAIRHARTASQVDEELTQLYQELALIPETTATYSGGFIREGKGFISYFISSNLSMEDALKYYDKELKAKGWIFKEIYKPKEGYAAYENGKSVRYTKRGYQCEYMVSIDYDEEKVKIKTQFGLVVRLIKK